MQQNHSMRACRTGADIAIEIEIESRIEFQTITAHIDDVDLVVAFRLDNTPGCQVFDQKVIRDHETFLVTCKTQIMRP